VVFCPDHPLNTPYTALLTITDGNGSPVTTGVTGSMSLYRSGLGATAAAVSGPTVMTHFDNGEWGVAFEASALGVAGYYHYTVDRITFGTTTLEAQSGGFTVGVVPPQYTTLRQIFVRVCQSLGCGVPSTTTGAGTTTTLKDTRWFSAGFAANEFVGDEILFLQPGAATDPNPVLVTGFDPTTGSTGTLTFAPAVTSTVSGQDYLLIRAGGRRLGYAQIREALDAAIAALATAQTVSDQLTLATTLHTREYALPATWQDVTKVEWRRTQSSLTDWWEEPTRAYWEYRPDRNTLYFTTDLSGGWPLRLTGTVGVPEARDLTSLVKVPWPQVRDWAVGYLSLGEAQRTGLLIQQSQRAQYTP
jgi:hypothetical protein